MEALYSKEVIITLSLNWSQKPQQSQSLASERKCYGTNPLPCSLSQTHSCEQMQFTGSCSLSLSYTSIWKKKRKATDTDKPRTAIDHAHRNKRNQQEPAKLFSLLKVLLIILTTRNSRRGVLPHETKDWIPNSAPDQPWGLKKLISLGASEVHLSNKNNNNYLARLFRKTKTMFGQGLVQSRHAITGSYY